MYLNADADDFLSEFSEGNNELNKKMYTAVFFFDFLETQQDTQYMLSIRFSFIWEHFFYRKDKGRREKLPQAILMVNDMIPCSILI